MPRSTCSVPGCKTGYISERKRIREAGLKNPTIFLMPKDGNLFERWCKRIPRKDRILTRNDAVCELHFHPDSIDRYFEPVMLHGLIHKVERERPRLKPDAEPTIFPNLPRFLSSVTKHRKSLTRRMFSVKQIEVDVDRIPEEEVDIDRIPEVEVDVDRIPDPMEFSFDLLTAQMDTLTLPSNMWTYSIMHSKGVIMIFSISETFNVMKMVKIYKDLHAEVTLKNEITVPLHKKLNVIECIEDLTEILSEVHQNVSCCISTEDCRRVNNFCLGYVNAREAELCLKCKINQKRFGNSLRSLITHQKSE